MRYLLFAGDRYYPSGGASDSKGIFATLDECYEAIRDLRCDWWQIYDLNLDTVIDSFYS